MVTDQSGFLITSILDDHQSVHEGPGSGLGVMFHVVFLVI